MSERSSVTSLLGLPAVMHFSAHEKMLHCDTCLPVSFNESKEEVN